MINSGDNDVMCNSRRTNKKRNRASNNTVRRSSLTLKLSRIQQQKGLREWLSRGTKAKPRTMNWGSNHDRSSVAWSSFMEGATRTGVPKVRCIYCSAVIQHPVQNGTKGMLDHKVSAACMAVRVSTDG
jgi:hypothetical protein